MLTDMDKAAIIKKEYKELLGYLESVCSQKWSESWERVKSRRSKCPFCGSDKVVQDIQDTHGKIKGKTLGSFGLFGGGIYGYVDGEIKTDEILRCLKCQNAWKNEHAQYISKGDVLEDLLHPMYFYFRYKDEDVEFDKDNPEEEFNSYEEKLKAQEKDTKKRYFDPPNILRNFHPETIRWAVENVYFSYDFYKEIKNWPDWKFDEYGCKQWPEPPKQDSMFTKFLKWIKSL